MGDGLGTAWVQVLCRAVRRTESVMEVGFVLSAVKEFQ